MRFEDISKMALNGEFLATLIDEYLDVFVEKNKLKKPSEEELEEIGKKVLKKMQEKYPEAGIVLKKEE